MKNSFLLLWVLLLPLVVVSCSETNAPEINNSTEFTLSTGSLRVIPEFTEADIIRTRASYDDILYIVLVRIDYDLTGKEFKLVEKLSSLTDGKINNIPVGYYDVTLTTNPRHPDVGIDILWDCNFGTPKLEGTESDFLIVGGEISDLYINVSQNCAGIYFIYDSSIEGLFNNLIPVARQGTTAEKRLEYSGANKNEIGYFWDGSTEIELYDGQQRIPIYGYDSYNVQLKSNSLWEVTLKIGGGPVRSFGEIELDVKQIR